MTRIRKDYSARLVFSSASIVLTDYAAYGLGDLTDVAIMHELGFSVGFSGTLWLLGFGRRMIRCHSYAPLSGSVPAIGSG